MLCIISCTSNFHSTSTVYEGSLSSTLTSIGRDHTFCESHHGWTICFTVWCTTVQLQHQQTPQKPCLPYGRHAPKLCDDTMPGRPPITLLSEATWHLFQRSVCSGVRGPILTATPWCQRRRPVLPSQATLGTHQEGSASQLEHVPDGSSRKLSLKSQETRFEEVPFNIWTPTNRNGELKWPAQCSPGNSWTEGLSRLESMGHKVWGTWLGDNHSLHFQLTSWLFHANSQLGNCYSVLSAISLLWVKLVCIPSWFLFHKCFRSLHLSVDFGTCFHLSVFF